LYFIKSGQVEFTESKGFPLINAKTKLDKEQLEVLELIRNKKVEQQFVPREEMLVKVIIVYVL